MCAGPVGCVASAPANVCGHVAAARRVRLGRTTTLYKHCIPLGCSSRTVRLSHGMTFYKQWHAAGVRRLHGITIYRHCTPLGFGARPGSPSTDIAPRLGSGARTA